MKRQSQLFILKVFLSLALSTVYLAYGAYLFSWLELLDLSNWLTYPSFMFYWFSPLFFFYFLYKKIWIPWETKCQIKDELEDGPWGEQWDPWVKTLWGNDELNDKKPVINELEGCIVNLRINYMLISIILSAVIISFNYVWVNRFELIPIQQEGFSRIVVHNKWTGDFCSFTLVKNDFSLEKLDLFKAKNLCEVNENGKVIFP